MGSDCRYYGIPLFLLTQQVCKLEAVNKLALVTTKQYKQEKTSSIN